jgi:predicted NUDIX family NTP pyrophosphohydrolase
MNERPRSITMLEGHPTRDLFGYQYQAAAGASTGSVRTAWGYIYNPLIDMPKRSAGLLMFRRRDSNLQVLLVHPGGPFRKKKDAGAWSIPKGEYEESEDPLEAAKREFEEETGIKADGEFIPLGQTKQSGGKVISAWAFEGDCSEGEVRSSTFSMEWPPKSGHKRDFAEVDRADWFDLNQARTRIFERTSPIVESAYGASPIASHYMEGCYRHLNGERVFQPSGLANFYDDK